MIESRSLMKSPIEWIIYFVSSDGKRKPVGILFGEFVKGEKTVQWVKGGKATIEVLPTSPSELEYKNRLSVLHAIHQTIFRIVPNQIGSSVGFSGERGFVYYFESSGKLMVSGKLRIKDKGEAKTYDGRHSLYINGIAAIIIRNGLVVIECRGGELFLDQTLPPQYREQMSVQFRDDLIGSATDRKKASNVDSRPEAPPGWQRYDQKDSYYLIPQKFFDEPLNITQNIRNRFPAQQRSRRFSDPITKRERAPVNEMADIGIRKRIIMRPQENEISNEWVEQKDGFGTWFFPRTFFGDVFPSLKQRQPTDRRPTTRSDQVLDIREAPQPISDRWGQEKDETGTWYYPKKFFGHPFPTASDEPIPQPSESVDISKDSISNEWVEQKDGFGTWFFPRTFFGDVFPSLKQRQPTDRRPTTRSDQVLDIREAPQPITDRWGQERDETGTWYYPKTFFGYPFPTAVDEQIPESDYESSVRMSEPFAPSSEPITGVTAGIPQPISDRWGQERDETGAWYYPKTFFGHPFPIASDEQIPRKTTESLTDVPTELPQQISDRWGQERDESGAWYYPKTFFGYPFPTAIGPEVSQTEQIRETQAVSVRSLSPSDQKQYSEVQEFVIYYSNKNQRILRPNATLIGKIGAQAIVHPSYERIRNEGTIRTVLLNPNDTQLLRDSAIVRHSSDLITVSANDNGIVKIYGETSGGFAIKRGSVLKVNGQLIISRRGEEDPPIGGICGITVNNGSVSLFICDNNHIILLDEGQNNYTMNRVSDGSQQLQTNIDSSLSSSELPPILTSFGRRDTGYGSGLEFSSPFQRTRTSTQLSGAPNQSQSPGRSVENH